MVTTKLYHVERAWTILEYLYRVQIQTQTIGWEGRGCNQVISCGASMDHSEYLYKVQIQTQTIGWEGRGYNQVISCGASMDHSRVPIQSTDTDYWLGGSWLQPSHIMWSEHGPFQSTYTKYRYRHRLLVGRVVVTTKLYHVERAWTILEYLYRVQIQTQTIGWEGRGCNQVISRGASMDHSRVPIQSTDTDTEYWLGGSWLQPSYIMWSEHGPFQSTYTEYRYRHRLLVGGGGGGSWLQPSHITWSEYGPF